MSEAEFLSCETCGDLITHRNPELIVDGRGFCSQDCMDEYNDYAEFVLKPAAQSANFLDKKNEWDGMV